MRKLPKRIITVDDHEFYPQVWFIWWHYCWDDLSEFAMPVFFDNLPDAIVCLNNRWKAEKKRKKKVVWPS